MKKLMKWTAAILVVLAVAICALPSIASAAPNETLKYSGPSGQGDIIWWAPATGKTNLVMGTNGITAIRFAYPMSLSGGVGSVSYTAKTNTLTYLDASTNAATFVWTNITSVSVAITNMTVTVTVP